MAQNKRLLAHIPARYAIANGDSTERFAGGTYLGGIRGLGVDCHFDALRSGQRFIYIWACGYRVWQAATVKAMPVDGMGGGTSDYMGTLLKRIHDAIKLPEISREMSKPICFVPNRSALDQKFDPDGPAHEEDSKIDFTDICVMSGSTEHVSVHDQTKRFILERLSN